MIAPQRAADFRNGIGVNTHMAYNDGKYANVGNVIADLSYLGISKVRDSAPTASVQTNADAALAAAGIKFDFIAPGNVAPETVVSSIESFLAGHPNSVSAIEGLNEINNFPVTYQGQSGTAGATAYMNALTTDLANSATLRAIDTYDLTGAKIADNVDYNNIHPYPKNGDQPYNTILNNLRNATSDPSRPTVITEAGYYTAPTSENWGGVDQLSQAKETLNLLLDSAKLGISMTYLYQLLDPYADPSGIDVDKNLGLFDLNNNPKLAATAIHNLNGILSDTAANAETFQPTTVDFSLAAQNVVLSTLEIQKASGATDIVVWSEPDIWNETTDTAISVAASTVAVSFGPQHVNVTVFDPLNSNAAIATYADVTSVNISVSDHPVIVEVTGVSGAIPAGTTYDPNNQAFGDDTNNSMTSGLAATTMRGGKGDDTYTVNNAGDLVAEKVNEGNDQIISLVSYHAPANVETLTLSGYGAVDAWANDQGMTLNGNSLANDLYGGAGNDTLNGGTGADFMAGGAGNDTYNVDNSGDVVIENAGEGTDMILSSVSYHAPANVEGLTLTGTAAIDAYANDQGMTLTGNSAANRLYSGLGVDTLVGGAGSDTYTVNNAADVVIESVNAGTDLILSSVSYHAPDNVEGLTLTGSADLDAWASDQGSTLTGNGGANHLYGGAGADTLIGGTGVDAMAGGAGNDIYYVDDAADTVVENAAEGTDLILSSVSYHAPTNVESLTLTGTANIEAWANDQGTTLTGNAGTNTLHGGGGNDILTGGTGVDTMVGGAGDDTYNVDNVGDVIVENAGEGTDQIIATVSYHAPINIESLTLSGAAAVDAWANDQGMTVNGNSLANHLYGGAGADTLNGGAGADTLTGGAGNDIYYVDNTADAVVEDANGGYDQVISYVSYHASTNIENLTLLGANAIDAWANDQGMTLVGNSLANHLYGGAGNDTLNGGTGADTMTGGAGNDVYYVDNTADAVIEDANGGSDWISSSVSYHVAANIESLTLSGTSNIDAWANDQGMTLTGNTGVNHLYGGAGADTLNGGAGADTMAGGAGNDIYYVDNTGDAIVENANEGADQILSSVSYHAPANVETLTLTGTAAIDAWANDQGMALIGNSAINHLYGGAGADTLTGGGGADIMSGGAGDDSYYVDNSGDMLIEMAGGGNDTVFATANLVLAANVENLVVSGSGAYNGTGNELDNTITGNSGANVLKGLAGNDVIDGGAGNDNIDGGAGNDLLHGGAGNDRFVFSSSGGADVIDDFTVGNDKLDVSAYVQAGLAATLTDGDAGVTISFSTGDSVQLLGIFAQDLHVTMSGVYY